MAVASIELGGGMTDESEVWTYWEGSCLAIVSSSDELGDWPTTSWRVGYPSRNGKEWPRNIFTWAPGAPSNTIGSGALYKFAYPLPKNWTLVYQAVPCR